MEFSPFSCHFLSLRVKYLSQHSILNTLSLCFSLKLRDKFSHIYKTKPNYISVHLSIYVFFIQLEDRKFWADW
jgi:hypothetical protein